MKTLTMVFWLMISAVVGQVVIQGTVVNQYGTIIPSARLQWKQLGASAGLDTSGVFLIPLSNITTDELRVSAYGYIDTVIPHSSAQSPLTITLHPVASQLQLIAADIPKGMKPVTGGTFQMGMADIQGQSPVHTVRVSSFWMDSTEVTASDFDTVMRRYSWYTGLRTGILTGAGMPLSMVSWHEAALYCNARSKRDGLDTVYSYDSISKNGMEVALDSSVTHFDRRGYRLPTEAEWEYAKRAFASTYFYWGNSVKTSDVSRYAVFISNSPSIQRVASKIPNAFGLYDMIGNVPERTNDCIGSYTDSVQYNPTGPKTGDWNAIRGCGWGEQISAPPWCDRASGGFSPATYQTGFRVMLRDTVRIPMLPDPHVVVTPDAPANHSTAEAGNPVTFYQSRLALCTKAHPVAFRYVWGDGDTSLWLGGASHQHTYRDSGIYSVKLQARCVADTSIVSDFSSPAQITVSGPHFIAPAPVISGPSQGKAGVSYSFDVILAFCNKGHTIRYFYNWGDGFTGTYSAANESHSWSKGGMYTINVFARCALGITSDTSRMTITIADTSLAPIVGNYRSGFLSFAYPSGTNKPGLDFSDSIPKQNDLVFTGGISIPGNITVNVPYGAYFLGSISIPNMSNFSAEKSRYAMDSIVSCMRILAPENGFQCCTTAIDINAHPVLIVKTSEGLYGLLILFNYWVGGLDHFTYYWGYQSDGSRLFSPDAKCGVTLQDNIRAAHASSCISVTMTRNVITVVLPGVRSAGIISLYDMRGCLVKRYSFAGSQATLDLRGLSGAAYLLKINSGKQEYVRRFIRVQ